MPPRYSEDQARAAIAASRSYAEALRRLGMCQSGGGSKILKKYVESVWRIPTDHFDPDAARREAAKRPRVPLEELLVDGTSLHRGNLKTRLYETGLKQPVCELCGQEEMWHGRRMSLILDHVNGVATDNRLENLRIVCPNCNATLDTHCGRNARLPPLERTCERCGEPFRPARRAQRYCSRECGQRWDRRGRPNLKLRRVERPPYEQLVGEVAALGYVGTGRKYGVSDNAIRKWLRDARPGGEVAGEQSARGGFSRAWLRDARPGGEVAGEQSARGGFSRA